ncbi:MAG: general secretion pathway protein GspB [Pseudomonadota bacterium]
MSLILDALKKSDNERKTNIAPDMAATPAARDRQGPPLWLWWFIALLVINLVVLLFVLTRDNGDSDRATERPASRAVEASSVTAPVALPAKQPVESLASAAVPPRPAPATAETQSDEVSPTRAGTVTYEAQPTPTNAAPARASAPVEAPPPENDLPLFGTLRAEGRLALDELNIDLHVYNADPARRFVFINGARYNEGDTLSSGPRVDRIRRDGIEMSYRGLAFLLPRE